MNVGQQLGLVNHEAECAVIGTMLQHDDLALALVQQLAPDDFSDPMRALVFEGIRSVLLGVEPLNHETILAECRRLAVDRNKKSPAKLPEGYLGSFTASPADAVKAAITLHRLAWLRRGGEFAFWLVQELQMNPDPNVLYTEAQSKWQLLAPAQANGATLYGWDTIRHGRELLKVRKESAADGTSRRYDWPWASWNTNVRPGIAGWVGVLAAPDGVGKSAYLEYIAEHWAQRGNKTVLVHLEDNHEYKINRRLCRHSKVPLDAIEDGTTTPDQDLALADADRQMAGWADNLHYTHAPGWSMTQILAELQKLIDEGECDCIVLDYIDKCEPDRRQLQLYGNNQYLREGDDMNRLKNFAEKNNLPIFTATQGNKSMQEQGKTQTRQGIDGSGKKSQRAQLVIILTRDLVGAEGLSFEGRTIAQAGDYSPIATIRIDKQNRGKQMTFHQFFKGAQYRIADLPPGFKMADVKEK
jgi:replicative DNA helicase